MAQCVPDLQQLGLYFSAAELSAFVETEIWAEPGDVLIMLGGLTVHGSPAGPPSPSAPPRVATYAHYGAPTPLCKDQRVTPVGL